MATNQKVGSSNLSGCAPSFTHLGSARSRNPVQIFRDLYVSPLFPRSFNDGSVTRNRD